MKLGGLFGRSSTASKPKALPDKKKKIGIFGVEWPDKPMQQPKDYKVIKTAVELIDYLKRCEETGICGFDYETTISDEYLALHHEKEHRFNEQVYADKKAYVEAGSAWDDYVANDFLKSPLDPWKAQICTVSLSAAPHEARVVFIDNPGFNQFEGLFKYDTHSVRKLVMQILNEYLFRNKRINKVAVNLSFETKHTAKHGMYIMEPCSDPFLMWMRCIQVLAPHRAGKENESPLDFYFPDNAMSGKGLKPITKAVFGVEMANFTSLLEKHGVQFFSEISADHPDAISYSAEDADYAVQHYLYWSEAAKQIPRYMEWLQNIEMPFSRVIGLMEYWGLEFDRDRAEFTRIDAMAKHKEALDELTALAKEQGCDIDPGKTGKTKAVKEFIFNVLEVPVAKVSDKTNDPSLDFVSCLDMKFMLENKLHSLSEEDALKDPKKAVEIAKRPDHPHKDVAIKAIDIMMKAQKMTTLISSHIDGRVKYINAVSGRVHSGYTTFTETGRLNSFGPNMQNIPKKDMFGIRKFHRAPKGKILFFVDFSGFEMRLMAWAANDKVMIDAFNNGADLHRKTGATLTGKPESEVTDEERGRAKAGNFGCQYGGTGYALQKTLKKQGIRKSVVECDEIVNAVLATYPNIPVFQKDTALLTRELGYAETLYGYKRMLPNIRSTKYGTKSEAERQACNVKIQGTAADIMKKCQNQMYELIADGTLAGFDMIAQVHDEVVGQIDDDPKTVLRCCKIIRELMEQPPTDNFPLQIVAEASVGYNWGEKMSIEKYLEGKQNV